MGGGITLAKMHEWPAWQRWGTWLAALVLYAGGLALLLGTRGVPGQVVGLVLTLAGLVLLSVSSRAVLNERMRSVDRWSVRVMVPTILVYMVLMLYVWPLQVRITVPWLKALVVLVPLLPLLVVVWATIRYVNRLDELERRQHLEAAAVAVVVVSVASFGLGLLAASGLMHLNAALTLLLTFPALCVVYGTASAWTRWRNRAR